MLNNLPEHDALIPVGKIIGTQGIRGQLKVHSYSGNLDSLKAVDRIVLKSADGAVREFGLKSVAANAGKINLGLNDCNEISQVLDLVGSEICLLRSQLPEPGENEYYWSDLLGLEVVTVDGEILGSIADIFETGSNDVYVVRNKEREYLIPAVAPVISNVNLKRGIMVITPLEGLLEL